MTDPTRPRSSLRSGFSLTEVLVVIGLIILIMAIVLPAMRSVRNQSLMANSMSNLRQVATFMSAYSRDNREAVLPSQFDYSDSDVFTYPGKVRSESATTGEVFTGAERQGTWADILWTENELGPVVHFNMPGDPPEIEYYRYDAPDAVLYEQLPRFRNNPFRAAVMNSRGAIEGDGVALPYGDGARGQGRPGYFAANDFFNARPDAPDLNGMPPQATGRWYFTGQIRAPERSMYLVDSWAGEVIFPDGDSGGPYDNSGAHPRPIEADFRYSGAALMLFLDGHVDPVTPWLDLCELEVDRGIRVRTLDQRSLPPGVCP